MKGTRTVQTNYKVTDLLEEKKIKNTNFLPEGKFTVRLDYPFTKECAFTISGPKTSKQLASAIARKYSEIYKNPGKWGIWGHGIDDLWIESLYVDLKELFITVEMGS